MARDRQSQEVFTIASFNKLFGEGNGDSRAAWGLGQVKGKQVCIEILANSGKEPGTGSVHISLTRRGGRSPENWGVYVSTDAERGTLLDVYLQRASRRPILLSNVGIAGKLYRTYLEKDSNRQPGVVQVDDLITDARKFHPNRAKEVSINHVLDALAHLNSAIVNSAMKNAMEPYKPEPRPVYAPPKRPTI